MNASIILTWREWISGQSEAAVHPHHIEWQDMYMVTGRKTLTEAIMFKFPGIQKNME